MKTKTSSPKKTVKKTTSKVAATKAKTVTRSAARPAAKRVVKKASKPVAKKMPVNKSVTVAKKISPAATTIKIPANAKYVVLAALLLVAAYYFRSSFIVATVNGQPISRMALVKRLEQQAGRQTLDNIVTETIILQEAASKKIEVSDLEVEQEINKIKEQLVASGQDFDQILALQNMTLDQVKDQIKIQKIVDKLVESDVKEVSEQEVDDYIEQNKEFLGDQLTGDELRATVRQQLSQQQSSAQIQNLVQSLKDSAKISHWLFKDLAVESMSAPAVAPPPAQ